MQRLSRKEVGKFTRFFLWGAPGFAVAFLLNYALIRWAGMSKPPAYAIVLAVQVTINFFACRYFVFDTAPGISLGRSFLLFFNGIILFRVGDWIFYVLLTHLGVHFAVAQLCSIAIFGILKYLFSKRVFESPAPPRKL
ncbi:MAG TPA: GtrA family protein [Verrucomicrobia bacterium]|nr:GtrA family protein [Verrucomicrobiota bacterium]HOB31251.1 GtrA family protein [Verrucomicrobiota bacterium]HOP97406.1 GtrA family protein [Verrucomicrobiota bacterium]HPU54832.1 GtrA family protein [Verrucomicrobiota bacterium]